MMMVIQEQPRTGNIGNNSNAALLSKHKILGIMRRPLKEVYRGQRLCAHKIKDQIIICSILLKQPRPLSTKIKLCLASRRILCAIYLFFFCVFFVRLLYLLITNESDMTLLFVFILECNIFFCFKFGGKINFEYNSTSPFNRNLSTLKLFIFALFSSFSKAVFNKVYPSTTKLSKKASQTTKADQKTIILQTFFSLKAHQYMTIQILDHITQIKCHFYLHPNLL